MLFRRRHPESFGRKLRLWVWPRRSWRRSIGYFRSRILRLNATPHAIAAGIAAGVFASFTPLFGMHFFIAMGIAWMVSGSVPASILGTFFGNPLTFPIIWASTFEVGRFLVGTGDPAAIPPVSLSDALWQRDISAVWEPYLKPMLVGSLPLGLLAAVLAYSLVYAGARGFRAARLERAATRNLLS